MTRDQIKNCLEASQLREERDNQQFLAWNYTKEGRPRAAKQAENKAALAEQRLQFLHRGTLALNRILAYKSASVKYVISRT